jgi:hypothetical protein
VNDLVGGGVLVLVVAGATAAVGGGLLVRVASSDGRERAPEGI